MLPSVSICVANYKQDQYLIELKASIEKQTFKDYEICIYNDLEGCGSGEAFNRAIAMAKGDIIVLMCADDYFTDPHVIEDIVSIFIQYKECGHVSRYYYQFVDGDVSPVRAWRCKNICELANNPSGIAFRSEAIKGLRLTNKMFVEAPTLVSEVVKNWKYKILEYDSIAVRIHKSTARSKDYYQKMWTSSPIEEWRKINGESLLRDYTSLIQIKNYFTIRALIQEIWNFAKYKPSNLLNPAFYFFSIVSLVTPRAILLRVPEWYRATIGKWTTRQVKRL